MPWSVGLVGTDVRASALGAGVAEVVMVGGAGGFIEEVGLVGGVVGVQAVGHAAAGVGIGHAEELGVLVDPLRGGLDPAHDAGRRDGAGAVELRVVARVADHDGVLDRHTGAAGNAGYGCGHVVGDGDEGEL